MTHLPRLATMIFGQMHMITPAAAQTIIAALDARIGPVDLSWMEDAERANAFVGEHVVDGRGSYRGYRRTAGGAAIVPVQGELVNRGSWLGARSGLVSYEGLRHTMRTVAADAQVKSVVLDMDSPGGMVAGAFETAQVVADVAKVKPVTAVANGTMASAAYLIASGATKIVATDTGHVGSIGVLYVHTDQSGHLAQKGVRVTMIHAGAHKVDGNPFAPLPDSVRADIQSRIDNAYSAFVDHVAAARGLTSDAVRKTEARVYDGREAVSLGLADSVGTFDSALADAEAGVVRSNRSAARRATPQQQEAARMQIEIGAGPVNPPDGWTGMSPDQVEHAVTALRTALMAPDPQAALQAASETSAQPAPVPGPQPVATAPAAPAPAASVETADAAYARGRVDATARIRSILGHAEAADRQVQAHVLALESDLPTPTAVAMLAAMPKETAKDRGQAFYNAVAANGGNPGVRHSDPQEQAKRPSLADGMRARFHTKKG